MHTKMFDHCNDEPRKARLRSPYMAAIRLSAFILVMSFSAARASHCVPDGYDALVAAKTATEKVIGLLEKGNIAAGCKALDEAIQAVNVATSVPQSCFHRGANQQNEMAARIPLFQSIKVRTCAQSTTSPGALETSEPTTEAASPDNKAASCSDITGTRKSDGTHIPCPQNNGLPPGIKASSALPATTTPAQTVMPSSVDPTIEDMVALINEYGNAPTPEAAPVAPPHAPPPIGVSAPKGKQPSQRQLDSLAEAKTWLTAARATEMHNPTCDGLESASVDYYLAAKAFFDAGRYDFVSSALRRNVELQKIVDEARAKGKCKRKVDPS